MKYHLAMVFCDQANSLGIPAIINNMVNGWIETLTFRNKIYFAKSSTYNLSRRQYFQGVDPPKIQEHGDYVLICGGVNNILTDIFIIPWYHFFRTIRKGEAINTYKPPREYFQYKFYLRDREARWHMSVQGGIKPILDVTEWHYNPKQALDFIKAT
jgi:hypothetical protein